ncbi:10490_t:CDS:10 [Gigaspora margarita]|uniref:10490_t:CDS:1 n=1 Tax=Gigaspora margarita TaxID=4874 RepID=A0ABM8VWP5_GIGMA|nr:10490_t:CDS:10 [Gigaspora margarita]
MSRKPESERGDKLCDFCLKEFYLKEKKEFLNSRNMVNKEIIIKLELATFCYEKYLKTGEENYLEKAKQGGITHLQDCSRILDHYMECDKKKNSVEVQLTEKETQKTSSLYEWQKGLTITEKDGKRIKVCSGCKDKGGEKCEDCKINPVVIIGTDIRDGIKRITKEEARQLKELCQGANPEFYGGDIPYNYQYDFEKTLPEFIRELDKIIDVNYFCIDGDYGNSVKKGNKQAFNLTQIQMYPPQLNISNEKEGLKREVLFWREYAKELEKKLANQNNLTPEERQQANYLRRLQQNTLNSAESSYKNKYGSLEEDKSNNDKGKGMGGGMIALMVVGVVALAGKLDYIERLTKNPSSFSKEEIKEQPSDTSFIKILKKNIQIPELIKQKDNSIQSLELKNEKLRDNQKKLYGYLDLQTEKQDKEHIQKELNDTLVILNKPTSEMGTQTELTIQDIEKMEKDIAKYQSDIQIEQNKVQQKETELASLEKEIQDLQEKVKKEELNDVEKELMGYVKQHIKGTGFFVMGGTEPTMIAKQQLHDEIDTLNQAKTELQIKYDMEVRTKEELLEDLNFYRKHSGVVCVYDDMLLETSPHLKLIKKIATNHDGVLSGMGILYSTLMIINRNDQNTTLDLRGLVNHYGNLPNRYEVSLREVKTGFKNLFVYRTERSGKLTLSFTNFKNEDYHGKTLRGHK